MVLREDLLVLVRATWGCGLSQSFPLTWENCVHFWFREFTMQCVIQNCDSCLLLSIITIIGNSVQMSEYFLLFFFLLLFSYFLNLLHLLSYTNIKSHEYSLFHYCISNSCYFVLLFLCSFLLFYLTVNKNPISNV